CRRGARRLRPRRGRLWRRRHRRLQCRSRLARQHRRGRRGGVAPLLRAQFLRPSACGAERGAPHARPGHGRRAALQRLEAGGQSWARFRPLRPAQGGDALPHEAIRPRSRARRDPRQRGQRRPHPQRPADRGDDRRARPRPRSRAGRLYERQSARARGDGRGCGRGLRLPCRGAHYDRRHPHRRWRQHRGEPPVTAPPLSGIDHVIIAVEDLERARLAWTRLGFTLTPRGRHLQQGTGNYCIMFERDYLELLGAVDAAQTSGGLDAFLRQGEGLRGLAFATRSGEATAAELARRGLHPTPPRDLARQLELPEGSVLPRFKLTSLPPEEMPALSAFICQNLTPELVRRPQWLAHPNGVTAIAGVTIMVEATEPLRDAYDRLFGSGVNTTD